MLKSISYSAAIDILRTDVQVGLEVTHSLWAGGATDAANIGVCDFIYEEKPCMVFGNRILQMRVFSQKMYITKSLCI